MLQVGLATGSVPSIVLLDATPAIDAHYTGAALTL